MATWSFNYKSGCKIGVGELYRFTRSGAYFGTFWKPERFCLMNFTAI